MTATRGGDVFTPHPQALTNTEAARWLADVLDRWGITDPGDRAEWLVEQLVERGVRPVPVLPPLRGPGCTDAGRADAKARIDAALEEARRRSRLSEGY